MKKIYSLCLILFAFAFTANAQYYINTYNPAGTNPGGLNTDAEQPGGAGYVAIIAANTTAATWSPVQTIPFPFSFDGSPVTTFRASNSGVVTFASTVGAVPSFANTAIPSASIPDKSVMVWGIQQMAGNDAVYVKTFGAAPNRQHWVYYASFSAPGAAGQQWTYWGIVMEETSNKLYVVDMRTFNTPLSLSIGVQTNSTTAFQLASNPNTPSFVTNGGSVSVASDNVYYEFIQGVQSADDMEMNKLNLPVSAIAGTTVPITGTIKNAGTATQDTVTVTWTADNGATLNAHTFTGLNLAAGATYNYTHPVSPTASNMGNFNNIAVWTSLANGKVDANPINDTLTGRFWVNGGNTVPRKVLLEEYTTAVCQFCPDGAVVVEQVLAANPDVIAVGVHACFGTDAMTTSEASIICSTIGSGAAPTGMIDRTVYPGESTAAFSRGLWLSRANAKTAQGSPVDITLNGHYDPSLAYVPVTVSASFADFPIPGNINISVIVVEDSVTGTGGGYNQVNAYNTQAGHPYFQAGNPIVGFVHRHVMRDVWPATFGDQNAIPANIALYTPYTVQYNIPLNASWDKSNMSLVATVNYSGPGVENFQILNAIEVKLDNLTIGIDEQETSIGSLKVSPNPSSDITNFDFALNANEKVEMSVYDLTGKLMTTENFGVLNKGNQRLSLDVSAFSNGFYFVKLSVGAEQITRKISVLK